MRDGYGQKKANAIFKGSLMIMTVLLWEGSGICKNLYPVWAADESARYGQYGTFDMGNSEAAGKIGTDITSTSLLLEKSFPVLTRKWTKRIFRENPFCSQMAQIHKAHRHPKIREEQRVYKCTGNYRSLYRT
ncbi:MAG: hypothetical protein ACLU6Y_15835 [Ruminococcus sp.]